MPEVTGRCPMCEAELVVTHLRCQQCGTGLEGVFRLNKFDRLSRDHVRFVDVFMKNRGVIREVERELGISYPTVRNRLDEVVRALGYEAAPGVDGELEPTTDQDAAATAAHGSERRRSILEQLDAGQITADDAVQQLRSTGND